MYTLPLYRNYTPAFAKFHPLWGNFISCMLRKMLHCDPPVKLLCNNSG